MPTDTEEKVKPQSVDIFDQSLSSEAVELNPDANAFAFPPPPSEKLNPVRVKLSRGDKGWLKYEGKNGKPGYMATDIKATIIAPGVEGLDGKLLFDNFASTMVMTQSRTSRIAGILKAIYDTRGQGETVPAQTDHLAVARLLEDEFQKEAEVGVWIQWEAYCEACSTDDKRVVIRGEKRFPLNADKTGHLGETEHPQCGSTLSAQAKITRYVKI
jgi:hypothetical protein